MSQVYRYKAVQMISEGGGRIGYDPYGPEVVMAQAYDALLVELAEALVLAEQARNSSLGMQRHHLRELIDHLNRASGRAVPSANVTPMAPPTVIACHIDESCGQGSMPIEAVERDERAEFEASYAKEFSKIRGHHFIAEDIASMRDSSGGYGDRAYLNGQWAGWQARAALQHVEAQS